MTNSSKRLAASSKSVSGEITLSGSKSISNRVLIIKALCKDDFEITNLSDSDDTKTLVNLLASNDDTLDAHHAGTTFRFLTSYLSIKDGTVTLTGSERMQQRPIGPLVNALKTLGANINYENKDGYPPLNISGSVGIQGGKVSIDAGISSQFISSLLLIAPTLNEGLELHLEGELVSKPYLIMTLKIMEHFGVRHTWDENVIRISPQAYIAKDFYVEADWSAASYYYSIAALSEEANITLYGLTENSLQGDQVIAEIGSKFNVSTEYFEASIRITKVKGAEKPMMLEYNFMLCPDVAQTVSVMCAGLGVQGLFSGLKTLYIKETDRVAALQTELLKIGVFLNKLPAKFSSKSGVTYHMQEGIATTEGFPSFATYNDHRMAMALAPLALLFPIEIEDPDVVSKSYPMFWEDLFKLSIK